MALSRTRFPSDSVTPRRRTGSFSCGAIACAVPKNPVLRGPAACWFSEGLQSQAQELPDCGGSARYPLIKTVVVNGGKLGLIQHYLQASSAR
jgi:hypothetical protein